MSIRRKCRLVNSNYKNIDLRKYKQIIVDTIEATAPNKHPEVYEHYFVTDKLTQGEAIAIGRELSKISDLAKHGKRVESFRLFDGKTYDDAAVQKPRQPKRKPVTTNKGGRMK